MTTQARAGWLSKAERRRLLAIATAPLRGTIDRLARITASAQGLVDRSEREALLEKIRVQESEARALLRLRVEKFKRHQIGETLQQRVLVPFSPANTLWAWKRCLGTTRTDPLEATAPAGLPFGLRFLSQRCRLTGFLLAIASRFHAEKRVESLADAFLFPPRHLPTGSAAAQSRRAAPTAAPPSIS